MHQFTYHRPTKLDDAATLLSGSEEPRLLAGGMSLLPSMKLRLVGPSDLVDLGGLEDLRGVMVSDSQVRVGAMTCHADVAANADVRRVLPALAELADGIGDPAVRHRGTLGGSIANADPAACYPAAIVGLDADVGTSKRTIRGADFFEGLFTTALEPDEIVKSAIFKVPRQANYQKLRHPAAGFAVVGVMVARFADTVRVAVTGAGPSVFRVEAMEQALADDFSPAAIEGIAVDASELMADIHFSADYRANAVSVLARRCVAALA